MPSYALRSSQVFNRLILLKDFKPLVKFVVLFLLHKASSTGLQLWGDTFTLIVVCVMVVTLLIASAWVNRPQLREVYSMIFNTLTLPWAWATGNGGGLGESEVEANAAGDVEGSIAASNRGEHHV